MYEAIIISDLHLGSTVCRVDKLEEFLVNLPETKRLILNGDVLESSDHRLNKKHWRILSLLRKLSDRLELVWIKGNHDFDADAIAGIIGATFVEEYRFESGGSTFIVVHGDRFDNFIINRPWLTWLATKCHLLVQWLMPKLAIYIKRKSKTFCRCCEEVRSRAMHYAGYSTILCGHTHRAEWECSPHYLNTGCWTEDICHYAVIHSGVSWIYEFDSTS